MNRASSGLVRKRSRSSADGSCGGSRVAFTMHRKPRGSSLACFSYDLTRLRSESVSIAVVRMSWVLLAQPAQPKSCCSSTVIGPRRICGAGSELYAVLPFPMSPIRRYDWNLATGSSIVIHWLSDMCLIHRQEIDMRLSAADTPYLLNAPDRGALGRSQSLHRHKATGEQNVARRKSEAPDPTYWTGYDLYMIEREARSMRRAYIYSTVATLWKRLRQRIFGTRLAA